MKLILEQRSEGADEVIIRYREMTGQIEDLIHYVERQDHTLAASLDGQQVILRPRDIIYFESVDSTTYIYTEKEVCRCSLSLAGIEEAYPDEGFFRCSKSMVINIYRISRLKSEPGNRIDALMDNGEHVIISRRYAKNLRNLLKGASV